MVTKNKQKLAKTLNKFTEQFLRQKFTVLNYRLPINITVELKVLHVRKRSRHKGLVCVSEVL